MERGIEADRSKQRWRDAMKEEMARNQMTINMAEDRQYWHILIGAGTLLSVSVRQIDEILRRINCDYSCYELCCYVLCYSNC